MDNSAFDAFLGSQMTAPLKKRGNRTFLIAFALAPILWGAVISCFIFSHDTPGIRLEVLRDYFAVTRVDKPETGLLRGDRITHISGVPYTAFLSFTPAPKDLIPFPANLTVIRDKKEMIVNYHAAPVKLTGYVNVAWVHLLLSVMIAVLVIAAVLKAPADQPAHLFLITLTFFSLNIINETPLQFGILSQRLISFSVISATLFHWMAFSSWTHFVFQFPVERRLLSGHAVIVAAIYLIPPAISIISAFATSGQAEGMIAQVQGTRRWATPFIVIITFTKHLIDYRLLNAPLQKAQLKLMLSGGFIAMTPYLCLYLLPYVMLGKPLISFQAMIFFAILLPLTFFLAIVRYRFMDVDRVISRGATYSLLILGLIVAYSAFIALFKQMIWGQEPLSGEIYLFFILCIALLFNPVKTALQDVIDPLFIKDQINYDRLLLHFSNRIAKSIELPDLIDLLTIKFPEEFQIRTSALVISDSGRDRIYPPQTPIKEAVESLKFLPQALAGHKKHIHIYEGHNSKALADAAGIMEKAGCPLIFTLKSSNRSLGMLILGEKTNSKIYSGAEIRILATLANNASIAVENALTHEALKESRDQIHLMLNKVTQAEKLAAIGEMTATLAHEIRNPLGIIRSTAEYLADGDRPADVQEELLSNIIQQIDTLNIVVDNTLGLARYKTPQFKTMDVAAQIRHLIDQWRLSPDHHPEVEIRFEDPGRPIDIIADEKQLSQVFINLMMNSEEAMPDGGRILIRISSNSAANSIELTFSDTGSGIAAAHEKEIFKKFFTTKKNGLGLGLAVCRQIINAHNGAISLANNDTCGVCATVRLPVKPWQTVPPSPDNRTN